MALPDFSKWSEDYLPSSHLSVSASQTHQQIIQEHMDTMHSDINSFSHKHDHVRTETSNLRENIGHIDTNLEHMRNMISITKAIQKHAATMT
jgi:peptidoglycan hydrolase CwlO-like protein